MQYQVLVEHRAHDLFFATVVGVPDCVAEGATQEEALTNAKAVLKERLARSELFTLEVEETSAISTANPWLEVHGSLRDDPTFDDFMAEIASYRQQRDAEESELCPFKDVRCFIFAVDAVSGYDQDLGTFHTLTTKFHAG